MAQDDVINMDPEKFFMWMAYDLLKDEKYRKRIEARKTEDLDDKERAKLLRDFFTGLTKGNKNGVSG